MVAQIGQLLLDFLLQLIPQLLAIGLDQARGDILRDVLLDLLLPTAPLVKESLDEVNVGGVWSLLEVFEAPLLLERIDVAAILELGRLVLQNGEILRQMVLDRLLGHLVGV